MLAKGGVWNLGLPVPVLRVPVLRVPVLRVTVPLLRSSEAVRQGTEASKVHILGHTGIHASIFQLWLLLALPPPPTALLSWIFSCLLVLYQIKQEFIKHHSYPRVLRTRVGQSPPVPLPHLPSAFPVISPFVSWRCSSCKLETSALSLSYLF